MKKLIFLFILFISILVGNFFLRTTHIKVIESSLDEIQKKFSDLGLTLKILHTETSGKFFWDVELNSEMEFYTTLSNSIIYFYIPTMKIYSQINLKRDIDINIALPQEITGHVDLDSTITSQSNLAEKYILYLKTKNTSIINIKKNNLNEEDILSTKIQELSLDLKSNKVREKFIDIAKFNLDYNLLTDQSKLHIGIYDFNIYLNEEKFVKYLSKTIPFNDISKNMDIEFNLHKVNSPKTDDKIETLYNSNINYIAKIFDVRVDVKDKVLQTTSDKKSHQSEFNFDIKNIDLFIDYWTAMIVNNQDTENERVRIIAISQLLKECLEKYGRKDGNRMLFTIKDTEDKKTLLENTPINIALKPVLDKFQ
jgi:hypothetical protein